MCNINETLFNKIVIPLQPQLRSGIASAPSVVLLTVLLESKQLGFY